MGVGLPTAGASAPQPAVAAGPAAFLTRAPQPALAPARLQHLLQLCGPADGALLRAAGKLLEAPLATLPLNAENVTFAVRTAGGPYVRAQGLRVKLPNANPEAIEDAVNTWLSGTDVVQYRRCGMAVREDSGTHVQNFAMVMARASAELAGLPSRVPHGSRLQFRARSYLPITNAELLVMEPTGAVRHISSQLSGDRISAGFYLDTRGTHKIQLMVDYEGGPEPALEAWVAVDEPFRGPRVEEIAKVEAGTALDGHDDERLLGMINRARSSIGVAPLVRSPALDRVAQAHARAMQRQGRLAHDLGQGDPVFRVQEANVFSKTTGENLARAISVERGHRGVLASPSHRENLLAAHFDKVGIGIARDPSGQLWICELLVDQD